MSVKRWKLNNEESNILVSKFKLLDWLVGRLVDWLVVWLVDWLVVRLVGWLID